MSFRSVLALLLLATVAAVCFSLGLWQLDRAAQRDALRDAIERGRQQSPLTLIPGVRPAELTPWRPAVAQGHWSSEHTVLLENRNFNGRPGYWVATPLLLADGANPSAVLVLRGWLARDLQAAGATPEIPHEQGLVEVRGELHAHVPRIFELWQWAGGTDSRLPAVVPAPEGAVPSVQNLALAEYARATGLRLLPTVLAQTHDSLTADGAQALPSVLQREWPGPGLDSDQNRGYALQWFGFCGIAVVAAFFVLRNMARRRAAERSNRST